MLEDSGYVVAGDVVDRLRVVVEGGDYGEDGGAGFRGRGHVADVDEVQRRFADAENEWAALFQTDVGGAFDEVLGEAVGDAAEGAHGAGENDHAVGGVGAAGDVGAYVLVGELHNFGGVCAEELLNEAVGAVESGLFGEHAEGAWADDEVDVSYAVVGFEGQKHVAGEECTARSGDGEGEIFSTEFFHVSARGLHLTD